MRKRLFRLLMTAVVCGLMFGACNKEEQGGENGGGNGGNTPAPTPSGKLPAVITLLNHENRTQTVLQIGWEGNKIHMLSILESNESGFVEPVADITPTYESGRMASLFIYSYEESGGVTASCEYEGNRLMKIDIPHTDPVRFDYDNSGNLRSIIIDGDGPTMRWNNGNISWISTGDGSANLTYDDTHNPLNELFAAIFPSWTANINNIATITSSEGEVIRPQYTREGDAVTLMRFPGRMSTTSLYIKYTDGSGEAPESYFRNCRRVNVESSGNGYACGCGYYATGSTATLVAEPSYGATFSEWHFSDGYIATENPYTFTVTGNTNVYAYFNY